MRSFIIYCPHLNRDVRGLLNAVPFTRIWTGEKTERGEDGCLQCHQGIVRLARASGWPAVFVMEDDCAFTPHFDYAQWAADVEWAAANRYDVLVGGCVQTYDPVIVRPAGILTDSLQTSVEKAKVWLNALESSALEGPYLPLTAEQIIQPQPDAPAGSGGVLVHVSRFHSAHCIAYLESGYDKILRTVQPFDVSVGEQGARIVMTYPFVAVQRPTYSGILQQEVNYVPLYKQYEEHLGRALGLRA